MSTFSLCVSCDTFKTLESFSKCKRRASGVQSYCKSCAAEKYKSYALANKIAIKERMEAYRVKNADQISEQRAEYSRINRRLVALRSKYWYWSNRDYVLSLRRNIDHDQQKSILISKLKYRAKNKKKISEFDRNYRKNNRFVIRRINAKRRSAKIRAVPGWADHQAIDKIYRRAYLASRISGKDYQVDHIVPLNSKLVCGLHCEANLQIISKLENIKKGNRFWPEMP